jgi:hydroxybutyrate-dimer hydrolase
MRSLRIRIPLLATALAAAFATCAAPAGSHKPNTLPRFVRGEVVQNYYDGVTDDLLTAGLGMVGLAGAAPPLSQPPNAAELRRLAIYNNYRALVDITPGGGYGSLYGPNVANDGTVTPLQGLIPGWEVLAFARSGRENVTLMVQIPAPGGAFGLSAGFDPARPCILVGVSSGSRGIYGAIGTAGDWGLKQGCAVAYADKGTGMGTHDLESDTVNLLQGERALADQAGRDSHFTARLSDRQRTRFLAEHPDRIAFKHAHSRVNPEADWGRDALRAVEFALWAINETYGEQDRKGRAQRTFTAHNTLVIASSVSNGGGAAVLAAEQDRHGLIDAVAVSEPNVNPQFDPGFAIRQGDGPLLYEHSRSLIDYTTLLNLYQGCANRAPGLGAPFNLTDVLFAALEPSANRCASLREKGLLDADDLEGQALQAQAIINGYGILVEQNTVQPSHWWASVPQAIALTYANAYARAGVEDSLCGFGFAATAGNSLGTVPGDGSVVPWSDAAAASVFGTGNGIPPTAGVEIVNERSSDGARLDRRSVSPSSGRTDENLDGALCLRALAIGADPVTGAPLTGRMRAAHEKLRASVDAIRASGHLGGRPAVFVTGRADAIIPPNHGSRAYYALNQRIEGNTSGLRYYEVTDAQHLDAFNAFAGFDARFVPLHHYFIQAHNLLWDHLTAGTPLPPSQVVRPIPRGAGAPPITPANLPDIAGDGAVDPANLINFDGAVLRIPQ